MIKGTHLKCTKFNVFLTNVYTCVVSTTIITLKSSLVPFPVSPPQAHPWLQVTTDLLSVSID